MFKMKEWQTTLDSAKRIVEINDSIIKHSGEVVDLLNSYLNEEEK